MSGKRTSLSMADIADLRQLVSIAVWIRSEQLAQRDVQRLIKTVDSAEWKEVSMPLTFIDSRSLALSHCINEHEAGVVWWNRLNAILESFGEKELKAKWRRSE